MSFLMSVTRISNTMLNRNGKSVHLCLASDLGVKTIEYNVSCRFVINSLYYVEICSIYSKLVERLFFLYHEWILSFVNTPSASIEIILSFLSFIFLMWYITLVDLHIFIHPCIPGINPT